MFNQGDRAAEQQISNAVIALLDNLVTAQPSFTRIALIYHLLGSLATTAPNQADQQQVGVRKKTNS